MALKTPTSTYPTIGLAREKTCSMVLVAGTLITSQSLMVQSEEERTGASITTVKAFTNSGGTFKSEKNLLKLLLPAAAKADFDLIVIETGTNEMINIEKIKGEKNIRKYEND